jgi:YesN/AraC family two-component response regulator
MESMSNQMPANSILLVEDEKLTLDLLTKILTRKFPDVPLYTASNGRTGLELFKAHTPDIVITDINMPEMGGMQMVAHIRAIKPGIKFIVLTGDTGKLSLEASVEKGFEIDHYIVKPVDFQELFAAVEQCLGEISQQNRN